MKKTMKTTQINGTAPLARLQTLLVYAREEKTRTFEANLRNLTLVNMGKVAALREVIGLVENEMITDTWRNEDGQNTAAAASGRPEGGAQVNGQLVGVSTGGHSGQQEEPSFDLEAARAELKRLDLDIRWLMNAQKSYRRCDPGRLGKLISKHAALKKRIEDQEREDSK